MNKVDYNRFRLLDWIRERKQITRGNLTREGLGRFGNIDLPELNSYVGWALASDYLKVRTERIPGKRGIPPKVYTVTPKGKQWLKDMSKQAKRELEGLK